MLLVSPTQCDTGLVCYQREPGEEVPGCAGGEDADSHTDYCVNEAIAKRTYTSSSASMEFETIDASFTTNSDASSANGAFGMATLLGGVLALLLSFVSQW